MKIDNTVIKYNTRGVLVLILIYAHIPAVLGLENISFYECSASWLYYPRFYLFNPFYISCYFLLEGFSFDFKKSLTTQLRIDFRDIIIPCLLWGIIAEIIRYGYFDSSVANCYFDSYYIYGPPDLYILYMLVVTRVLYKLSLYIRGNSIRYLILGSLVIIGCIINNYSHIRYWEQALILLPFVEIGRFCNYLIGNKTNTVLLALLYIVGCISLTFMHIRLPLIHDGMSLSLKYLFIYLLLGAMGSFLLIVMCNYIQSRFVQYIGRNYVTYILIHISVLFIIVRLFYDVILKSLDSAWSAIGIVFLLFMVTLAICTCFTLFFKANILGRAFGINYD